MRTCRNCGKSIRPDDEVKNGPYVRNQCRECRKAYGRQDYQQHKKKRLAEVKRYYQEHRDEKLIYAKSHYKANRPAYRRNGRNRRVRITAEVFAAYGGKCACCGETEQMFLSIDHMDGNGNAHRKLITGSRYRAGINTYEWLYRNDFPPGFQVLCYNCNIGKHRNKGICPHKARSGA